MNKEEAENKVAMNNATNQLSIQLVEYIETLQLKDPGVICSALNVVLVGIASQYGISKDKYLDSCLKVWDRFTEEEKKYQKKDENV